MKKRLTQKECRELWEALRDREERPTIEEIDAIDNLTPWSEIEPNWWLDMMMERRYLVEQKTK